MKGDFTTPQAVATKMLPFVLQSQVDTEPGEERPGFISSLFQTSGFRERNLSPYEQMEKVRNKAAKTWIDPDKIENPEQTPSGKKWYELPLDARRHFNVNSEWSEELKMRTDAFQDNSNGPSKPYFDEIDKERFDYHEASSNAFRQFALNGNGPQMEAAMHDANVAKAYSRELRENNANYDDVRKKLQESRESGTEEQFNRMVEMYVAEVANNPEFVDEFGNFDYDSRDAQDAVFQTKVSEDLYIRSQNYLRGRLRDGSRIPEGPYAYPDQGEFCDKAGALTLSRLAEPGICRRNPGLENHARGQRRRTRNRRRIRNRPGGVNFSSRWRYGRAGEVGNRLGSDVQGRVQSSD